MGTERSVLGYVVVMKPYRKHGNGAKGSGRLGNSGKKCFLYKINTAGSRELIASAEGTTAKAVLKEIRSTTKIIPQYVAVSHNGETFF